jgi:hypothetical protein
MELINGTPAFKAHEKGLLDRLSGKKKQDNPYLGHRYLALSNWWNIGYGNNKDIDISDIREI